MYTNPLDDTPEDYIAGGDWKEYIVYSFLKPGITYTEKDMPKVEILGLRKAQAQDSLNYKGFDYIAQCQYKDSLFDYPFQIPNEIKSMNYKIDTLEGHIYRKIVYAKNPTKGITGIYLKDIKNPDNDYALNLVTAKLNKEQQDTVLKIFSTVKMKK